MQNQATPSFTIFDDYRPMVSVAVVVRWVLVLAFLFINNYRVDLDTIWVTFNVVAGALVLLNGYMTWLVLSRRPITWVHAFATSIIDLVAITMALFLSDGFENRYFVFYYPALLGLSLMFRRRVSFSVLGVVMALYVTIALTVSPTLDTDLKDEKVLFIRLVTMLGVVVAGTLIAAWERTRRREAVAAERRVAEENLALQKKAQETELVTLEERGRIAREIHDGIAQSIYMLNLNLETCAELAEKGDGTLGDRLKKLVPLAKQTLLETRHYIYDLKPLLAGERALMTMVENQIKEFQTVAGIPVRLSVEGDPGEVPLNVGSGLYRILQEALANVLKHSGATEVEVRLRLPPEEAELMVWDNGKGFDGNATASGHGLGNMRQRAQELGGTCQILSSPEQGACVKVAFPAQEVERGTR